MPNTSKFVDLLLSQRERMVPCHGDIVEVIPHPGGVFNPGDGTYLKTRIYDVTYEDGKFVQYWLQWRTVDGRSVRCVTEIPKKKSA
jgi:hypothetical protein